jgi:hypothetical protein
MRYTVVWVPWAERELARVWLRGLDRTAIRTAAFEIDRLLRNNPAAVGESRFGGQRIVHVPPLGATFSVYPDDRLVQVLDVWWYGKRSDAD